jgi:hypothetical protein
MFGQEKKNKRYTILTFESEEIAIYAVDVI